MTEETTTQEVVEQVDAPTEQNVEITVEQICAAIINTLGNVQVPLENLISDYSGKSIAVQQDEETKALTFSLTDIQINPEVSEETPAENE